MLNNMKEVCKFIGTQIDVFPICIETGSAYSIKPTNLMNTTTNNISKYICSVKHGILFSLDVNASHQALANFVCSADNTTAFLLGDSVKSLNILAKTGLKVDLLCLDSAEFDTKHAMREFKAIQNNLKEDKHFVLVDDIHNPNSVKYKEVVPFLKKLNYNYIEINTPTGLFLAAKGYKLNH